MSPCFRSIYPHDTPTILIPLQRRTHNQTYIILRLASARALLWAKRWNPELDELKAGMPGIRQSIGRSALTAFIIVSFFEGLTAQSLPSSNSMDEAEIGTEVKSVFGQTKTRCRRSLTITTQQTVLLLSKRLICCCFGLWLLTLIIR